MDGEEPEAEPLRIGRPRRRPRPLIDIPPRSLGVQFRTELRARQGEVTHQ